MDMQGINPNTNTIFKKAEPLFWPLEDILDKKVHGIALNIIEIFVDFIASFFDAYNQRETYLSSNLSPVKIEDVVDNSRIPEIITKIQQKDGNEENLIIEQNTNSKDLPTKESNKAAKFNSGIEKTEAAFEFNIGRSVNLNDDKKSFKDFENWINNNEQMPQHLKFPSLATQQKNTLNAFSNIERDNYEKALRDGKANAETFNFYMQYLSKEKYKSYEVGEVFKQAVKEKSANTETFNFYMQYLSDKNKNYELREVFSQAVEEKLANAETFNFYMQFLSKDKYKGYEVREVFNQAVKEKLANAETFDIYIQAAKNANNTFEAEKTEKVKVAFLLDAEKKANSPEKQNEKKESTFEIECQLETMSDGQLLSISNAGIPYDLFENPKNGEEITTQKDSFAKLSDDLVCKFLENNITSHEFLLGYLSDQHLAVLDFNKIPVENIEMLFTPALLNPYFSQVVQIDVTEEDKKQNEELFNKFDENQQKTIREKLGSNIRSYL